MVDDAIDFTSNKERPFSIMVNQKICIKCFKKSKTIELRGTWVNKNSKIVENKYKYFTISYNDWDLFCKGLQMTEKYMNNE